MKAAEPYSRTIRFGDFEVDLRAGELHKHGVRIRLQEQPLKILTTLVERAGDVVSREEFRQALWSADTFVDFDHGLSAAVNKLREALSDSADRPRYVETIPRRGYRFIAELDGFVPPTTRVEPQSQPAPPPRAKALLRPALIAGTGLLGVAAVLVGLNVGRWRERVLLRPASAHVQSIAVLPLANLSGDPSQEYFADGMTEELVTQLGKVSALRVISHTSVNRFKSTKTPLQQIARELNVDAVVEGTVAREGNRVRVTTNLIQANPEKHLWAESYDRDLRNVLDLQGEIARTVADQIKITVTPAERLRLNVIEPVDPEAHELLLKGYFYFEKWNDAGFKKAAEYFTQSVQKEPQNARAYAGLAIAYAGMGISDPSAYSKEEVAALQALKIDDNLGEAHNALAWAKFTLDWDTVAAEREFRRAIELNPNDARAHSWYGIFLAMLGRIEDSRREVRRTRELDPLSFAKTSLAWRTYYNARDYDNGIQMLQNVAEMDPSFVATYWRLTLFYEQKGEFEKAIQMREEGAKFNQGHAQELTLQSLLLRKAYAARGARGYWNQELQFLKAQKANDVKGGVCCDDAIGLIYTRLGRKEEAIRSLEQAFNNHLLYLIWQLPASPDLDPLRSDSRFAALLARLLPPSQ